MTVRLEIHGPAYRRGLAAVLDELGHRVDPPGGVSESGPVVRVLDLDALGPAGDETSSSGNADPVVAVIPTGEPTEYQRALALGATGVLPLDAPAHVVGSVIQAAAHGLCLARAEALREVARLARSPATGVGVSPWEVEWLRGLANGQTVAQLAESAGYSERALFRLLHDLYGRLGASNRTEAIITATRRGWLDEV